MNKKFMMIVSLLILTACTDISVVKNELKSKREIIKQEFKMFNQNTLVGKEFVLESEGYKGKEIFIGFTNDRIYGSGGINRFFGKYKVADNKLSVENIGVTKMAGNKEDMIKEFTFLSIFNDENEISLDGYKLILKTKEGIEFEFRDRDYSEEVQIQKHKNQIKNNKF